MGKNIVEVIVTNSYDDLLLGRKTIVGEILVIDTDRLKEILKYEQENNLDLIKVHKYLKRAEVEV